MLPKLILMYPQRLYWTFAFLILLTTIGLVFTGELAAGFLFTTSCVILFGIFQFYLQYKNSNSLAITNLVLFLLLSGIINAVTLFLITFTQMYFLQLLYSACGIILVPLWLFILQKEVKSTNDILPIMYDHIYEKYPPDLSGVHSDHVPRSKQKILENKFGINSNNLTGDIILIDTESKEHTEPYICQIKDIDNYIDLIGTDPANKIYSKKCSRCYHRQQKHYAVEGLRIIKANSNDHFDRSKFICPDCFETITNKLTETDYLKPPDLVVRNI